MAAPDAKAMTLRLPPALAAELQTVARVEARSLSDTVRAAIGDYVERRRADPEFSARLRRRLDDERDDFARFLGAGNVLRGVVRDGVLDLGAGVTVPAPGPNGPAAFVVRPEDVHLDPAGPIRARVVDVVDAGAQVRLTLADGDRRYEVHAPAGTVARRGEDVRVTLPVERLWRLPA